HRLQVTRYRARGFDGDAHVVHVDVVASEHHPLTVAQPERAHPQRLRWPVGAEQDPDAIADRRRRDAAGGQQAGECGVRTGTRRRNSATGLRALDGSLGSGRPVESPVPRTRTADGLALHPDLESEQAYVDFAYECLEAARRRAASLGSMVEVGRGGTEQARFERDVIWDTIVGRLRDLELGDASLIFGRIDRAPLPDQDQADTFYIGRLAV